MDIGSRVTFTAAAIILMFALGACTGSRNYRVSPHHGTSAGPLQGEKIMAFAATRDGAAARAFYEGILGLRVVMDEPMSLVLDSGGTIIRIQKIPSHQPVKFTVLGWEVSDIGATARRLKAAGVKLERFDWMKEQDETGVATFGNGDKVAWFYDPDGNTLSIAQLRRR